MKFKTDALLRNVPIFVHHLCDLFYEVVYTTTFGKQMRRIRCVFVLYNGDTVKTDSLHTTHGFYDQIFNFEK